MTRKKGFGKTLIAIGLTIVIFSVLLMGASIYVYKDNFGGRLDYTAVGTSTTFDDLENISREPVSFMTKNNIELSGFIYTGNITPKAMVIFAHGFVGTHQWGPYLKELEQLVANGYSIFTYDNKGCGISAGKNMAGFPQAVIDLDYALTFIELHQSLPIILYGHSWGGFAVSSILNTDHDVIAVVERSGFNSGSDILSQYGDSMAGILMKFASPFMSLYERIIFGKYAGYTAVDGINNSDIPVLLMHSTDDTVYPYRLSITNIADKITNPLVQIHIFENKKHDISLSDKALAYKAVKKTEEELIVNEYNGYVPKDVMDKFYEEYDYAQAEELDMEVISEIITFMDNAIKK